MPDEPRSIKSLNQSSNQSTSMSRPAWWGYRPLPRFGRIALCIVVIVAFIAHAIINWRVVHPSGVEYLAVAIFAAILAFAWKPPVATFLLVVCGAITVTLDAAGPYALALCLLAGLVVYTCGTPVAIIYCGVAVLLAGVAEWYDQGIEDGGSLGVLAVLAASAIIGVAFRRGRERVLVLAAENDRLAQDTAGALKSERDRIADELHNIIAHDLTIVAMQARALELVDHPEDQHRSLRAISESASQALTDIRRMLRIVQDDSGEQGTALPVSDSFLNHAEQVRAQLESVGLDVRLELPASIHVSSTINTTLCHVVNECSTNILKYAIDSRLVQISLVEVEETVELTFWNARPDGTHRPNAHSPGYGLRRMSERVELLGGTMSTSEDAAGWKVLVALPTS